MSRGVRRAGARLAAVVAMAALAALPAVPAPAATPEADPDAPSLTVSTFDPPVAKPRGTLTATGRVSAGADDLSGATVRLRVSTVPVSTRGELAALAAGDTRREGTERASSATLSVDAGGETEWALTVPTKELGLSAAGVYPVSIDLHDGRSSLPVTSTVTFLAWYPDGTVLQPTRLTWVVPLAGRPVRDAGGTFLDDSTAADLATGGRLRTLLDSLADSPVDWAFDPELLEAADAMTGSTYRVLDDDGEVVPGGAAGSEAARTFLEKARAVLDTETSALAYAHPDADALQRAGLESDLAAALTTGSEVAEALLQGTDVGHDVAVPAGGHVDRRTLVTLRTAGIRTVVLAEDAVPLSTPLTYTPDGVARLSTRDGEVVAALADSTLTSIVTTPEDSGGDALARQRFVAETLVITKERPSVSRSLVVAPPRDWDVHGELAAELVALSDSAPWLDVQRLADLRRVDPPDVERDGLTYPSDAAQLTARQTEASRELNDLLETYTGILDDPATTTKRYRSAILRTESSAWQNDRRTGTALVDAVRGELERDIAKVRILSRGTVTLSGDEGRIPITVDNDLDQAVVVAVRISTRTPGRFSVEQPGELRIGAGRTASVEIPARAASGGTVPIQVQLFTRTGEPFGEAVDINVRSSAYSRLGAAVVGAALAALVVLVVARLTRRVRASRRKDAYSEDDDAAGTTA